MNFSRTIEQREQQSTERGIQSLGILKDQCTERTPWQAPVVGGKKTDNYKRPSLTSNEVFYHDYKGNARPNVEFSQSKVVQASLARK
jgi:hypothetical protein